MAGLLEEAEGIIEETKVEMFVMPQWFPQHKSRALWDSNLELYECMQ
jgi:hypothetical protein